MKTESNLLWIMLFCLPVISLNTQNLSTPVEITKGEIIEDETRHSNLLFAESDGKGGVVTLRGQSSGAFVRSRDPYLLEHYDSELNLLKQTTIPLNRGRIIDMILRDGKIILLEHRNHIEQNNIEYIAITKDLKDFTMERHNLLSAPNPYSGLVNFMSNLMMDASEMGGFNLDFPQFQRMGSETNYIVLYLPQPGRNNTGNRLVVYDLDFEEVMDVSFQHVRQSRTFMVENLAVDHETGVVYLLGVDYFSNNLRAIRRGRAEYLYTIYRLSEEGVTHNDFRPENKFVSEMTLLLHPNGLYCIGGYSTRNNNAREGMAYFKLDPESLEIQKEKTSKFTKQAYVEKFGEGRGTRRHNRSRGIQDLTYRDFYIDHQGNIFFTAEEHTYRSRTRLFRYRGFSLSEPVTNPLVNENDYVLRYNDVLAGKIDPSGNLKWMRTINKKQNTRRSEKAFLSYSTIVKNGKMYLFFNSAPGVREKRDGRNFFRPSNVRRSNLYMVEVNGQGPMEYRKLIGHRESRLSYKIFQGASSGGTKLFVEGQRRNEKQILKLEL